MPCISECSFRRLVDQRGYVFVVVVFFFVVTPIDEKVTHLLKQTSSTCISQRQQYLVRNPLLSLKFGTY